MPLPAFAEKRMQEAEACGTLVHVQLPLALPGSPSWCDEDVLAAGV